MSTLNVTGDEIRANVTRYLEESSVMLGVAGGHLIERDHGDRAPWKCFEWRASFRRTTTGAQFDTMYYAGLAHVYPPNKSRPKPPHAADVLYTLLADATANSMSFKDWCSDYDYSEDSMKALETYRACCDEAVKLSVIFNRQQIAALREMLDGY